MNDDQPFRSVLMVAFVALLLVGLYHRVKSQTARERLDRRQEGAFILATLRPIGAALWLGLIAWLIDPRWLAWSRLPLPSWSRWTGVGLLLLAGALLVWTLRCLGKNLTDTVVTRQQHTLVSSGPYRWVRHPFYDCAILLALAVSLITANWFFLATGVVVFGLLVIRTRTEEANLLTRFGVNYQMYMDRTGRFLPGIGAASHRIRKNK